MFSVVDPVTVGAAKRASELSSAVGERLLRIHMSGDEEEARAKQIAENLNKSFFAHGDAVSRTRAKELQLKITPGDPKLEDLLWGAYVGLESYLELRKPFNPLQQYLANSAAAAAVQPIAPLAIPANTPPALAQQIWQAAAQQVIQAIANKAVEVEYSVVNAVLESVRVASEYRTSGKMHGFRNANGEIQLSAVDTESGWSSL